MHGRIALAGKHSVETPRWGVSRVRKPGSKNPLDVNAFSLRVLATR